MSYAVTMDAKDVSCKIPVSEMPKVAKKFYRVFVSGKQVNGDKVEFVWEKEEDGAPITGTIVGAEVVLDAKQHGTYKNSSDGGLGYLLTTFKGSGIVTEDGESGDDHEVTKYVDGKSKVGKITFDEEDQ